MTPSLSFGLTIAVGAAEVSETDPPRLTPALGGVIALQPIAEADQLLKGDVVGAQITLKLCYPATKGIGALASLSSASPSIEDGLSGVSSPLTSTVTGASGVAGRGAISSQIKAVVGV